MLVKRCEFLSENLLLLKKKNNLFLVFFILIFDRQNLEESPSQKNEIYKFCSFEINDRSISFCSIGTWRVCLSFRRMILIGK